jgi:hypothetical protein
MSAPIYATSADVQDRVRRPLTEDELTLADVLVDDASRYIRARFQTIDARIAAGVLDPDDVTMVVAMMVKRAITTEEEGVTQLTNTGGPFSQNVTFANPMGDLYLKPTEVAVLAETGNAGRVRSVRVTTE